MESSGEIDHGSEAAVGLVVTRGDTAELLESLETVLDEMTPFVHLLIVGNNGPSVCLGGNDGESPSLIQFGAQSVIVKGLVRNEGFEGNVRDQRLDANAVMTLAGQQNKPHQIAQSIDQRNNLGRQPAPRRTDGLILSQG